jgi:hypothetical protein
MAKEKPLDLAIVRLWLAAWDASELFSESAVHHLQSLITDTHCFVVVTLGMGREPRSLVFRRRKFVLPARVGRPSSPIIVPSTSKSIAPELATIAQGEKRWIESRPDSPAPRVLRARSRGAFVLVGPPRRSRWMASPPARGWLRQGPRALAFRIESPALSRPLS